MNDVLEPPPPTSRRSAPRPIGPEPGGPCARVSVVAGASAMRRRVDDALARPEGDPADRNDTVATARSRRFPWRDSARRHLTELYTR